MHKLEELLRPSVLIIDDDPMVALALTNILEDNYQVESADSGEEGIEKQKEKRYDVIILDMQMPEMDGYETGAKIREFDEHVPIIVNTGHTKHYSEGDVEAKLNPFNYLIKGEIDPDNVILETTVKSAVKYRRAMDQLEHKFEKVQEVARIADQLAHRFKTGFKVLNPLLSQVMSSMPVLTDIYKSLKDDLEGLAFFTELYAKNYVPISIPEFQLKAKEIQQSMLSYVNENQIVNQPTDYALLGIDPEDVKTIFALAKKHENQDPQLEKKIRTFLFAKHQLFKAHEQADFLRSSTVAFLSSVAHEEDAIKQISLNDYLNREILPQYIHDMRQKNITVHLNLDSANPQVRAPVITMYEVITNLLQNAIEAIGYDGDITFNTTADKNDVSFTIENSGALDADINKIYDDGYSTKGHGTGKGLGIVKKLVESHLHGTIQAQSEQGRTYFTIKIPKDIYTTSE